MTQHEYIRDLDGSRATLDVPDGYSPPDNIRIPLGGMFDGETQVFRLARPMTSEGAVRAELDRIRRIAGPDDREADTDLKLQLAARVLRQVAGHIRPDCSLHTTLIEMAKAVHEEVLADNDHPEDLPS